MATVLLSAAGAAIGGSIGGTVAGLSSVAVGRAIGATVGRLIDNRVLGTGSEPVESGRVERFRLSNAGEGAPIGCVYGRMRVGGQVIWASDFRESATTTGGGKGRSRQPQVTEYSYSVSLALAVCEGEILGINRVWADGEEISAPNLNMQVYKGTADQLPDPVMEAVEGQGAVPAYRGTAYVVFENLDLEAFGNRVPQFSFEVVRGEQPQAPRFDEDVSQLVEGIALMPGTGEYALAATPVYYTSGPGEDWAANVNSPSAQSDLVTSVAALQDELPRCKSASLIVSWFGGDLRCGQCTLKPKVERRAFDGRNMPWGVSDVARANAEEIAQTNGRPIYGGTPTDQSVIETIHHMQDQGIDVMFYPFILMDQQSGNGLFDPWSGAEDQPALPWRGRITLSHAPGRDRSPDGTAEADAEVDAFFGTASAADFQVLEGRVVYTGPDEWSMRRFILHYAALCAAAGGVSAFCIGSEMRGLTQIRGASGFPAVAHLRALAAEARQLLGPDTKIGYAADWSEYFGYAPQDGSGDRYFHLDPLWADDEIDFVGIDNYMPLSDWRDGDAHLDVGWGSIYNPDYLAANVEGGEGFDWYYHSPEAEAAQIRTPITDGDHDEPWIWRYKDIRNWWQNPHVERIGGVRQPGPTEWEPRSKPIWFTELGCAAIDKGTNQPNKFLDPKSSESRLPKFSSGARDDFMQVQYLRAMLTHWQDPERNPVSDVYDGRMIDMSRAFVWAWDARPFPIFPNNRDLWADGGNYSRGHWLNGRTGGRTLASVVEEICRRAGVTEVDTSELYGFVRGYLVDDVADARQALQPLMLRYGFDAIERHGVLTFRLRSGRDPIELTEDQLAESSDLDALIERAREADAEVTGRVRVRFVEADASHDVLSEESVLPDEATHSVGSSDLPLSMTRSEGRAVAERWLTESRVARDTAKFALPPSHMLLGAGDIVTLPSGNEVEHGRYRIDRVEQSELQLLEAVRIEPEVYKPSHLDEDPPGLRPFTAPAPVLPLFLDLPLLSGDEVPHAPHLAVTARRWPGSVSIFGSASDDDYRLKEVISGRSVIGVTESPLSSAAAGLWDRGPHLQIKLISGALEGRPADAVLGGANLAAIGDGSSGRWEVFQFETAELIAPRTYLIGNRLRGQVGSDALMSDVWPVGSWFVLLNGMPKQIDLTSAQRRIAQHFRIGPAGRTYDDPAYVHVIDAFDGNGLRPYAPCHLRALRESGGGLNVTWIRRTRVEGDSWDLPEVPLGEERESYLVRVRRGETVLREVETGAPNWHYHAQSQSADGVGTGDLLEVAQLSARFGPGPFASLKWPGQ